MRRLILSRRAALGAGVSTFGAAAPSLVFVPACATPMEPLTVVDATAGREITLSPGPMPRGQCFSGVYRSPHVGTLTLQQRDSDVHGSYRIPEDRPTVLGYLDGRVVGNVIKVTWREHDALAPGRLFASGTGFFLYDLPEGRPLARLFGRRHIARQVSSRGGPMQIMRDELWTAVEIAPHAACSP